MNRERRQGIDVSRAQTERNAAHYQIRAAEVWASAEWARDAGLPRLAAACQEQAANLALTARCLLFSLLTKDA